MYKLWPLPLQKSAGDFTIAAVKGFIRSISLSDGNSLQDTLRLLTVWFEHGHQSGVYEALVDGLKTIQIDTWLQVSFGSDECMNVHNFYVVVYLQMISCFSHKAFAHVEDLLILRCLENVVFIVELSNEMSTNSSKSA